MSRTIRYEISSQDGKKEIDIPNVFPLTEKQRMWRVRMDVKRALGLSGKKGQWKIIGGALRFTMFRSRDVIWVKQLKPECLEAKGGEAI